MTLETENILDRRRLRRKLTLWRGLAIVAAVAAVAAAVLLIRPGNELIRSPQIARISITGLIAEDRKQAKMLKKLEEADHVKAVIVYVNSPGGTTTGGEALFQGIRNIAAKKPVVAQFGTVAASAAYIAGLGTDHIVARGNSITGSVGVIMQWPEVSGLMEKLGIKMHEMKSGDLKAVPSMFQPLDEEGRSVTRQMIEEGQRWFLGLVRERRKIDPQAVPGLTAGRVYSGRMALQHKLVDAIGGEDVAVKWLVEKRNVATGLNIVDWKPETQSQFPFSNALASLLVSMFVDTTQKVAGVLARQPEWRSLTLDGLVSVWHPAKN